MQTKIHFGCNMSKPKPQQNQTENLKITQTVQIILHYKLKPLKMFLQQWRLMTVILINILKHLHNVERLQRGKKAIQNIFNRRKNWKRSASSLLMTEDIVQTSKRKGENVWRNGFCLYKQPLHVMEPCFSGDG